MFTEKILRELKDISDNSSIRKNQSYTVGFAVFSPDKFEEVMSRIKKLLQREGEEIICEGTGRIVDCGTTQFHIKKAVFIEYYHYISTTSIFVRLYLISNKDDNKEWISLYIDENPLTPWWSKEEREKG
ncbi:MAG: hypothetical protein DRN25_02940 [Thermoplasmata archaeon]|nr:MAG: hypothetical protein DRN25_02940 [Thermoplasmata archaeon]